MTQVTSQVIVPTQRRPIDVPHDGGYRVALKPRAGAPGMVWAMLAAAASAVLGVGIGAVAATPKGSPPPFPAVSNGGDLNQLLLQQFVDQHRGAPAPTNEPELVQRLLDPSK